MYIYIYIYIHMHIYSWVLYVGTYAGKWFLFEWRQVVYMCVHTKNCKTVVTLTILALSWIYKTGNGNYMFTAQFPFLALMNFTSSRCSFAWIKNPSFCRIDINRPEIKFDHTNMALRTAPGNVIVSLSTHKGPQCISNEDYGTDKWITHGHLHICHRRTWQWRW